jgi:predicted SAM-dependent methyltransferase
MHVRQILRRSQTLAGLARDARLLSRLPRRLAELRRRPALIEAYLASHDVRKLHLGAGPARLEGWLDTDLAPPSADVAFLDATKPFPVPDATFDYVYSEHMIEHLCWDEGRFMLAECRRVLRPGGTVRIATPDLAVFLRLGAHDDGGRGERYVRWVTDRYLVGVRTYQPGFVINNLFRSWGHQFLYDGELLAMALTEAGFTRPRRARPGVSADPHLCGVESHGRLVSDEEMGAYETLVFEADRPA